MAWLTPQQLKQKYSLTIQHEQTIQKNRELLCNLVRGKDKRLAIVVGPCSVHDIEATLEYSKRFKALSDQVRSHCICVMRVYIEKPRTLSGWKGLVYDPDLDDSQSIEKGLELTRALFLELTQMNIPIATEILNPLFLPYYQDLISWGFIGARTSGSQPHREIASYFDFPMGFKNSLGGNIEQAIYATIVAQSPHRFPYIQDNGKLMLTKSLGNDFAHIVLRGSQSRPNYDVKHLQQTLHLMKLYDLTNRILIDCSHGNSQKNHRKQNEVFETVLSYYLDETFPILGMMLESQLKSGKQPLSNSLADLQYGISITDPCIGWEETEKLIQGASESIGLSNRIGFTHN